MFRIMYTHEFVFEIRSIDNNFENTFILPIYRLKYNTVFRSNKKRQVKYHICNNNK